MWTSAASPGIPASRVSASPWSRLADLAPLGLSSFPGARVAELSGFRVALVAELSARQGFRVAASRRSRRRPGRRVAERRGSPGFPSVRVALAAELPSSPSQLVTPLSGFPDVRVAEVPA
jgi:hypothetical protein